MLTDLELLRMELALARDKLESLHAQYRNGWIKAAQYHSGIKVQQAKIDWVNARILKIDAPTED